jgi:two-component system response regulator AtoC
MKTKILVVDDEVEVCNMLKSFLTKKGYEVIVAFSAIDGLEKLKEEKPKIILLDIKMPGMSGVEAIHMIREINSEVGIIMATAVIDETIAKEAVKLGAYDYLVKPFDLNYLEKILLVKLSTTS